MSGKRWQGKQKQSRWRSSDDNVPVDGLPEPPLPQPLVEVDIPLLPTEITPMIWPLPENTIPAMNYGLPPMENVVSFPNLSIPPRPSTSNSNLLLVIVQPY